MSACLSINHVHTCEHSRPPARDSYLTHTRPGGDVGEGILLTRERNTEYRLERGGGLITQITQGFSFTAYASATAAEARRIGEAWLKAAEDAELHEEFEKQEWLDDEAWQRDQEMELAREAEERGEEYVPYAIGVEHMNFIEMAVLHGEPLKPWQEDLRPVAVLNLHRFDGGSFDLGPGSRSAWFRWHVNAHPLVHVLQITHAGTESRLLYDATTDDFGSLVIVGDWLSAEAA